MDIQATKLSAVQLRDIKEILRHYCQGLADTNVRIYSTSELTDKGIAWISTERPATEGRAVVLPPTVDEFATENDNFTHYKVLATHQAAHLEFGTFEFSFDKSSNLFADVRLEIQEEQRRGPGIQTDLQRFFDLFPDRKLASDVFMVVEDTRVDYLLKQEYQGIRGAYESAQQRSLLKRPDITSLPAREALLEILIQLSVENWGFFPVPPGQSDKLATAVSILRRVRNRRSTVEDSAEATIRIFGLLFGTENLDLKSLDRQKWDSSNPLDGSSEVSEDDVSGGSPSFMSRAGGRLRFDVNHQGGESYRSPQEIDYRGGVKPELVQALNRSGQGSQDKRKHGNQATSVQGTKQVPPTSMENDSKDTVKEDISGLEVRMQGAMAGNGQDEASSRLPDLKSLLQTSGTSAGRQVALSQDNASFIYDEWDYLDGEYKRKWCRLRQRSLAEGSSEFYANTLKNYGDLVSTVRREFEKLRTERLRKTKRLQDGEEFDFDAVIDAIVERRAGAAPNDKIYWRRNKVERDVCVVFLLDMSASTYESVAGGYGTTSLLAYGASGKIKRIIDVEKESIVILVEALQAIGDTYGIYGFSGYGKDNVDFHIIKDVTEGFSNKVRRRIEKIAPGQETRMGTAIRHATAILAAQEHKTKLLLLLSDGRPQDHDYGAHHFEIAAESDPNEAIERAISRTPIFFIKQEFDAYDNNDALMKEYAVFDTRVALLEAMQRKVIPFCLTVDKRGHDYLKAMCGEIGYEVIDDITSLPKRLPALYRSLAL